MTVRDDWRESLATFAIAALMSLCSIYVRFGELPETQFFTWGVTVASMLVTWVIYYGCCKRRRRDA